MCLLKIINQVSYKARGSNASWEWLEIISPCVVALGDLQKTLNDSLGGDQGMKHAPPDLKADIESLMSSLEENEVYRIKKGRVIKDEDIVKDVVAVGLQNLTSGEKNPLSDYNAAFKRLQMRRKMKPVTLTLLQGHSESANSQTPPVQDVPPQTPLDTPQIPSLPTTEDEEVEIDPEQVSEVEKILQDIADGVVDETLPRLTEEDVAFDMDEIVVEEEEIVEEDEDEDDEDENDIGWINEEEGESGM